MPETCALLGSLTVEPGGATAGSDTPALTFDGGGTACTSTGAAAVQASIDGAIACAGSGAGTAVLTWADGTRSTAPVTITAATAAVTARGTIATGPRTGSALVANLVASVRDDGTVYDGPDCASSSSAARTFPASGTVLALDPGGLAADVEYVFGFFSPTPSSGSDATIEQLMEIQQNAAVAALAVPTGAVSDPTSLVTVESPSDTVEVMADPQISTSAAASGGPATERGYILRGYGKRSDFVYQSDSVYPQHVTCTSSGCRVDSEVKLSFKETVVGLNSRTVQLTFYSKETGAGRLAWRSHYSAYCAVNIKDAQDRYCEDWKDDGADNPKFNTYYSGATTSYYFGFYTPVTKFPMVNLQVTWSDGIQAVDYGDPARRIGYRFRGWDVCMRDNNTKLCAKTGNGK